MGLSVHLAARVRKEVSSCTTRDDSLEFAALVRRDQAGGIWICFIIPEAPLHVLAQQIAAICASAGGDVAGATAPQGDGWDEDELFNLVRRAYPYRGLKRETFGINLEMLSEGIAARRGRYGAYVHRDRVNRKLRARRGARLAAITSGGAIPKIVFVHRGAEARGRGRRNCG